LNQLLAHAGDAWWSHVTVLGDTSLALMCLLLLIGRRPDLAWQLVLAALFATLWTHGGKEMFSSLRPPAVLHAGTFHLIGYMLEHNSFPSGHTTTVFVLAGLVCAQPWDARYKALALMLATLIGLSRIACGVHWPLDVLGGVFGGWLSALAGIWLAQHWHAGLNVWFQRVLALTMTILVFWSIFFYDNGFPNTWLFQSLLSLSALLYSLKSLYRLFKFN
jgi:membrane-associated phospholipid phosphatase